MERSLIISVSNNDVLEGGVTIVHLPRLPIVPSTPYLLFQMGLLGF